MYDVFLKRILTALRDIGVGRFSDLRKVVKNPRTLTIKLEKLERLGLLKREAGGYRLTEKGLRVEATLEELEKVLNLPDLEVKNIERIPHAYFAPIIKRYSEILRATLAERLISIMLFGSVARGDWDKNSDIDILVVAEGWDARPVWERIEELKGAREILEKTPEYLKALKMGYWPIIQNYPLSPDEARGFNRIYLDAVLDGIIIYDRDDFLASILQTLRKKLENMGSVRLTTPSRRHYWIIKKINAGEVITFE